MKKKKKEPSKKDEIRRFLKSNLQESEIRIKLHYLRS